MFALPVTAERNHVRVFAQQQYVWNFAELARRDDASLQRGSFRVRLKTQLDDPIGFFGRLVHKSLVQRDDNTDTARNDFR